MRAGLLFPAAKRGEAGICYSPDTLICTRCPLAPATCDTSVGDDNRLRSRIAAPECLRDYIIWKLFPYLKPLAAREIGDRLAGDLDPARPETADQFRQAVDDCAGQLRASSRRIARNVPARFAGSQAPAR